MILGEKREKKGQRKKGREREKNRQEKITKKSCVGHTEGQEPRLADVSIRQRRVGRRNAVNEKPKFFADFFAVCAAEVRPVASAAAKEKARNEKRGTGERKRKKKGNQISLLQDVTYGGRCCHTK